MTRKVICSRAHSISSDEGDIPLLSIREPPLRNSPSRPSTASAPPPRWCRRALRAGRGSYLLKSERERKLLRGGSGREPLRCRRGRDRLRGGRERDR
ncbi:hypothetical protein Taro_055024 [Colocasia esculenta]|uniref:Uncharacterized protein n=1 Tax=Colocasia esculenta TaxID=4460 RepID=A0A843XT06_COLES|nr:hypothetical protein [Colocasia esculenta]